MFIKYMVIKKKGPYLPRRYILWTWKTLQEATEEEIKSEMQERKSDNSLAYRNKENYGHGSKE